MFTILSFASDNVKVVQYLNGVLQCSRLFCSAWKTTVFAGVKKNNVRFSSRLQSHNILLHQLHDRFLPFKPWNQFKFHLECEWGVYIEHVYSVRTCKSILIAIYGFTETQLLVWYEEEEDRERKPLFTILLSCKLSIPGILRSLLPRQQEVWPCGDRLPPTPGDATSLRIGLLFATAVFSIRLHWNVSKEERHHLGLAAQFETRGTLLWGLSELDRYIISRWLPRDSPVNQVQEEERTALSSIHAGTQSMMLVKFLHGANLTSCSSFQEAVPDLQPCYCTLLSHNSNVELEPKGVTKPFPLLLARSKEQLIRIE